MSILLTILLIVGLLLVSFGVVVLFSYLSKKRRGLSTDAEFVRKLLPSIDCGMCGEHDCMGRLFSWLGMLRRMC